MIFVLFRTYYKKLYWEANLFKVVLFYKTYSNFTLKIKKCFLLTYLNSLQKEIIFLSENKEQYKKSFLYCSWGLKKNFFCSKFSFLNVFIALDILKDCFTNIKIFILRAKFESFFNIYIKYSNTNNFLFFNEVWYLNNLYIIHLEKYFQAFTKSFFLKKSSQWHIIDNTRRFESSLHYLYLTKNYKIFYIRILNKICFYFHCKIFYVLQFYKNITIFLKFFFKLNLFCIISLNLSLCIINKKISKNLSFLLDLKKKIFNVPKFKFRLFFFFLFHKIKKKKNKRRLALNNLLKTILRILLHFFHDIHINKILLQQIISLFFKSSALHI